MFDKDKVFTPLEKTAADNDRGCDSLTGFTLIELLCVIIIISMLITISVPTINKTAQGFFFKNKAKEIESLLKFIKESAIIEQRSYKFQINFVKNYYTVFSKDSSAVEEKFSQRQDSLLGKKFLRGGLFFESENKAVETAELLFEPSGSITFYEFYIYDKKHKAKYTTNASGQIILDFYDET